MKKILGSLILAFVMGNCMLLNTVGLNIDRIKGKEAAAEIKNAAIQQDILISAALAGRPYVSLLSLVTDKLAGINEGATYYKPDVDKCVSSIKGLTGFIIGGVLTVVLDSSCDLKPDKTIMDSPFPEL